MVALLVALTVLACLGTERFMTKGHGEEETTEDAEVVRWKVSAS
jgi:hypothetical protein